MIYTTLPHTWPADSCDGCGAPIERPGAPMVAETRCGGMDIACSPRCLRAAQLRDWATYAALAVEELGDGLPCRSVGFFQFDVRDLF